MNDIEYLIFKYQNARSITSETTFRAVTSTVSTNITPTLGKLALAYIVKVKSRNPASFANSNAVQLFFEPGDNIFDTKVNYAFDLLPFYYEYLDKSGKTLVVNGSNSFSFRYVGYNFFTFMILDSVIFDYTILLYD